jgi:gluconolactonase
MSDVRVLAEGLAHPEGPDVLPDGRIVFVETFAGRLSTWDPDGGVRPFADVGGAPNACAVGLDGVYVTQNGGALGEWRSPDPRTPSIQFVDPDGEVSELATTASGVALGAPNDLAFGVDGRLYFTDPGHWSEAVPPEGRLCVLERAGEATVLVETGRTYPNGIAGEADGSIVWSESHTRQVRRRRPDGAVELIATLPENRIPDGLSVAADGSIYVTGITSAGLDVLGPDGESLGFVKTGGEPQNCVFVGDELYVADFGLISQLTPEGLAAAAECGRLLRVALGVKGQPIPRGAVSHRSAEV